MVIGVVITIDGLRELFVKKSLGKKITAEDIELAKSYVKFKEIEFNEHKLCCFRCNVKNQYIEAKNILEFLCDNNE